MKIYKNCRFLTQQYENGSRTLINRKQIKHEKILRKIKTILELRQKIT